MQPASEFSGCGPVDLPPVHLEEVNYPFAEKEEVGFTKVASKHRTGDFTGRHEQRTEFPSAVTVISSRVAVSISHVIV